MSKLNSLFAFLVAGFFCLLQNPGAQAQEARLTPVKLGLDFLSSQQLDDLWERTELFATAEAFLTACGRAIGVEKLALEAVQPCVTDAALERVKARFRARFAHHFAKFKGTECTSPASLKLIQASRDFMRSQISEAGRMCRACLIC